jgi:hypothetical protein
MAILAAVFGVLGRFVGKLLTAALGWASTLLFGRVAQDKQIVLVLITFGSIAWVAMLAGVLVPSVGVFLLAALPVPSFVDKEWVRLAMLIGAIVTPLLIGGATIFIQPKAERPRGIEATKAALRGYPLAFILAFVLVFLAVIGIVRKVRAAAKRWADAHVPVVVRPGGYERMVADLEAALDDAGLDVDHGDAPTILSVPGRLIGSIAGPGVKALVPDKLVQLTNRNLEIQLYPCDIAIAGQEILVTRARAALASRLASTAAFLTTSAEAQAIEARLERLARSGEGGPRAAAELASIDHDLATVNVPYEEWETLYRIRLQVERDLLAGHKPGETFPGGEQTTPLARAPEAEPASALQVALATLSIALVALDVALAIRERFSRP